jgi:hypothetical protein
MAMSRLIRKRLHRDEKMRAKDRVILFVCTNDDGSNNVTLSLSLNGTVKEPRCF